MLRANSIRGQTRSDRVCPGILDPKIVSGKLDPDRVCPGKLDPMFQNWSKLKENILG